MGVVEENDVTLQTTNVLPVLCLRRVFESRIRERTYEGRYLRTHAVLNGKGIMREAFPHQAFEKRPVQVESVAFFHCQFIVVHFWSQLPVYMVISASSDIENEKTILVVTNKNHLLSARAQGRDDMTLQYLTRFFDE